MSLSRRFFLCILVFSIPLLGALLLFWMSRAAVHKYVWAGGRQTEMLVPAASELMSQPFSKLTVEAREQIGNGRTLVVIALRSGYPGWFPSISRDVPNVEFFIRQVVGGPRSADVDFLFVDTSDSGPAIPELHLKNVRYIHRPNVGYDMCSYKTALALTPPGKYRYIVLMNGTVRGPFTRSHDFLEAFKKKLSAQTPVAGTTFNCQPASHIQSMFFMVNSVGAELLNATLSCDIPNKDDAVYGPHGEVNLTQNVLRAGFNIAVTQPLWRDHDFRDHNATMQRCENFGVGDVYYPMSDKDPDTMKSKNVDPEEVVFFKTTRKVDEMRLAWLTQRFDEDCAKKTRNCGVPEVIWSGPSHGYPMSILVLLGGPWIVLVAFAARRCREKKV